MSIEKLPSYEQVGDLLLKCHIFIEPAQMHGLLCGLLVCNPNTTAQEWVMQASGGDEKLWDTFTPDIKKELLEIQAATLLSLRDAEYRFEPFLPEDEDVIAERAHAIGIWCKGFVAGVELFGNYLGGLLGKAQTQVDEAMGDLQAIADVDHKIDAHEAQEKALTAIIEYVRIAVLLVQRELSESFLQQEKEGKTLH